MRYSRRPKGQAEVIQYTITILLGVIILIGATLIIFNLYDRSIRADIEKSLDQIAAQTSDRILKLYEVGKDSRIQPTSTSVLIVQDELRLPDAISNRKYEVVLITGNPIFSNIVNITINNRSVISVIKSSSAKVMARTVDDPIITVTRDLPNIEAFVQGIGDPTDNKLSYYRYPLNGTTFDRIILGSSEILIDFIKI